MDNFNISYNALYRAFDAENVIVPPALVKIPRGRQRTLDLN